jgi:CheY-like chemotaxis protein/HPt (histidine-containing phosphotransfer) domain-containing protein
MKKILIVEDDQIVANIYRNKLSIEGFRVEIALDGEMGLDTARAFHPDAVVLDLMLPKMTGVQLMKQIRAEPGMAELPIIVFSNTYLTNMIQEAWKAGATKCLSKASCTPKQVIDVIRSALGSGGAHGAAPPPSATTPPRGAAASGVDPPSPSPPVSDAEFQAQLRASFVEGLPAALVAFRSQLMALVKAEGEPARVKMFQELYRRIHGLTSNAAIAGLVQIAHMSDALEALLKELYEKPKNINASTMRTVATAIDFLGFLFEHGLSSDQHEARAPNILVVDDEVISRRALTYALEKAKLKCAAVEDPLLAYKMVSEKSFDLIFLDVDMPGMTGFELCAKLRALPSCKKTPVVFVTSLNDFESRAQSTMSGGNDFIGKPFLFIELAVKALIHLLRARLASK